VREVFLTGGEFQYLAGTLYREEFWLVSDHLGTPNDCGQEWRTG
jgi:hypothetical protein